MPHPATPRRGPSPATAALAAVAAAGLLAAAAAPAPAGRTLGVDEAWALTAGGPGDNPYGNGKCCVPYPPCSDQACPAVLPCAGSTHISAGTDAEVCGTPPTTPENDDPNCVEGDYVPCSAVRECVVDAAGTGCEPGDPTDAPTAPEVCADNCDFSGDPHDPPK